MAVTPNCILTVDSNSGDDITFGQALQHEQCTTAMRDKLINIEKNCTWTLVPRPPNRQTVSARWVFKLKPTYDPHQPRYKARLVARGFKQKASIEYKDTFALVVKWNTVRTVSCLAAAHNWRIQYLDVKTAFLHGVLLDEVYMEQSPSFQLQRGRIMNASFIKLYTDCVKHQELGMRQSTLKYENKE